MRIEATIRVSRAMHLQEESVSPIMCLQETRSLWHCLPRIGATRAVRAMALVCLSAVLAACVSAPPPKPPPPVHRLQYATANLAPVSGTLVSGRIRITAIGEGVHLDGEVGGLGRNAVYAVRVHERGDCRAADGGSAGARFVHALAIGDLRSNDRGVAQVDIRLQGVTLGSGGFNDILGRALVVHAGDAGLLPSGHSELRVACGVIDVRL